MKRGGKALFIFCSLSVGLIQFVGFFQFAYGGQKNKHRRSRLTYDQSEFEADKRRLLLTTGEDKAVDLDFEANAGANGISYGNPSIVTTTLVKIGEKRQIVFKPLKAGETTVTVRDNDGTIRLIFQVRITGSNLLRIAGEIRSLLRDIEGLEIRIVGSKVVVEGEVLVPNDYGRLLTVVLDKSYVDFVLNLTSLSSLAMQYMAKKIQNDVIAFAPNVRARVVNGMIFLEGSAENPDQAKRAESVAALYLPSEIPGSMLEKDPSVQRQPPRKVVQNFIVVNPPPPKKEDKLIRVTVHYVQLSKDYSNFFGFKWQPGFTADPQIQIGQSASGATNSTSGSTFSATISSLIPKLNTAQSAGFVRILDTGTVVVRSGQPAKTNHSTEFPFAQPGPNGQLVSSSKAVGFSLAVTPTVLGQSEDIMLDLDLDQTTLAGKPPVNGAPPVTDSHKVTTKIYVKSKESAAVAGITNSTVTNDFNKDDPAPGSFDTGTGALIDLYHTKNYKKNKSQFVIFVTPEIIENASDGTKDLKSNIRVPIK